MILESVVEVAHAEERVGDGDDDQNDGHDGERSKGALNGEVTCATSFRVNADKLEQEIGKTTKEEQNDAAHADAVFALREKGRAKQNDNGDGDRGSSKAEFDVCLAGYNNQELDREAQEEEEIKFQQCDKDLATGR